MLIRIVTALLILVQLLAGYIIGSFSSRINELEKDVLEMKLHMVHVEDIVNERRR